MIRNLTAVLLAYALLPMTAAAETELRPTFEAGTTFLWGQSTEFVLRNGTYDRPLSRLVWETPPSIGLELAGQWPWTRQTSTQVRLRAAWPLMAGTLVDEDWHTGTGTNDIDYGRSQHQTQATLNLAAEIEQTYLWGDATLVAGGLYQWRSWEAWNGSGTYRLYGGGTENWTFTGPLVAYHVQWLIPYVGLGRNLEGDGWSLYPEVRIGPYAFGWDRDDHNYAQNVSLPTAPKAFLDTLRGGVYCRLGATATFAGGPTWSWGVRGNWEIEWGAIGDTIETYPQQNNGGAAVAYDTDSSGAGAWFHELSLTFFVRN